MSQKQTFIHDSVTEEFVPTCRHCKKTAWHHTDGPDEASWKCLFDSTTWDPMHPSEWVEWRKGLWAELGGVGTDYIRDQLRQFSFARSMEQDLHVYGEAVIEIDNAPDKLTVNLVNPARPKDP